MKKLQSFDSLKIYECLENTAVNTNFESPLKKYPKIYPAEFRLIKIYDEIILNSANNKY